MPLTREDLDAVTQAREILKVAAQRAGIALAEHTAGDEPGKQGPQGEQDDDTARLEQLVTDLHAAADSSTAAVRELEARCDSPERGR